MHMALKCPFCDHEGMPIVEKKMSETGWIVFVLLVIFCLPLCWIPFVTEGTKEEIRKIWGGNFMRVMTEAQDYAKSLKKSS